MTPATCPGCGRRNFPGDELCRWCSEVLPSSEPIPARLSYPATRLQRVAMGLPAVMYLAIAGITISDGFWVAALVAAVPGTGFAILTARPPGEDRIAWVVALAILATVFALFFLIIVIQEPVA